MCGKKIDSLGKPKVGSAILVTWTAIRLDIGVDFLIANPAVRVVGLGHVLEVAAVGDAVVVEQLAVRDLVAPWGKEQYENSDESKES